MKTGKSFPLPTDLRNINEWMRKHGRPAKVTFKWARGKKTWTGKVTRMEGALDATTRTVPIVVEVKDPFKGVKVGSSPPLLPGMFVDVVIQGALLKNVVQIPRSALHNGGSVYLVSDGKLAIKKVKVEMLTRDEAIVSEGLKTGDKVILSPVAVPIPGTELRIAEES